MSYSIEFYAPNWQTALTRVAHDLSLPESIRDGLIGALYKLPHAGVVHVQATGHLRSSADLDYAPSWGEYKIRPINLVPDVLKLDVLKLDVASPQPGGEPLALVHGHPGDATELAAYADELKA